MGYTDDRAAAGLYGFEVVTGSLSGDFGALVPYGGSATFSAPVAGSGDDLPSATTAEGIPVLGVFSGVDVTAGTVLAYYRKPQ